MTVVINDADFTLHVGDVLDVLRTLADGSVDCCVTSPPYWGLRDYGTGTWEGGDPDCDHTPHVDYGKKSDTNAGAIRGGPFKDICGKCGARRVDRQIGLEPTPDEYVARIVGVFREVRRVLADHGTCWINLGDSYASGGSGGYSDKSTLSGFTNPETKGRVMAATPLARSAPEGLKPKDLVGIPWRVAFALQQDGWYLRSDIIWAKNNPMPESVTDRPTKAHEYVFLLTKRPRYFYDAEAIREDVSPDSFRTERVTSGIAKREQQGDLARTTPVGRTCGVHESGRRNARSVWQIATQPYAEAHFATFPEELPRRAILAGCPEWVCRTCGKPRERIVERTKQNVKATADSGKAAAVVADDRFSRPLPRARTGEEFTWVVETLGWSDCGHDDYRPGVVLDPFLGSGTTGLVARKHGRRCVGIELNEEYAELAARRTAQLSLLAEEGAA